MNPEDAALDVAEALQALDVPYMLVGSLSTNRYGIPRMTRDADFVVELGDTPIQAVARKLGPRFRLEPQMSFETVTGTLRHELIVPDTQFKVELFSLSNDPHDRERFGRRRPATLLGRTVWLPTVEDVIITKLRWASIASRAKDRDDVRDVIAVQDVQGAIDWPYVYTWCDRHDTRELLDQIRLSIPPL